MRLLSILLLAAGTLAADEIRYTYDKRGRIVKAEYSDGRTIVYTYDANGRLVRRQFIVPDSPQQKKNQPRR